MNFIIYFDLSCSLRDPSRRPNAEGLAANEWKEMTPEEKEKARKMRDLNYWESTIFPSYLE